ncbi:MAG: fibronectin type III domain-containing protein, partial [Marmoricola sp.]|nr:fibronectin type III domain-containing protein [Marmoricola sp.]
MLSRLSRVLLFLTPLALVFGLTVAPSEAAGHRRPARVSGVQAFAPNWLAGTLKLRWHAVAGATRYQVRMATDTRHLRVAKGFVTTRSSGIVSPRLHRSTTYLVQVRALRNRARGPWSSVSVARLTPPVTSDR